MDSTAGPPSVTFPDSTDGLEFTGERYLPGITGELQYEHLHRYLFAMSYVAGLDVLDIACGEGYGAAALAQSAARVLGVDISAGVVAHAASRYTAANLRFVEGRLSAIPAADASFDVIVCFETLEHVGDHDIAMREVGRVLRPDGILLISTPNSQADDGAWHDGNPYHQRELSEPEFRALLSAHFGHVTMMEQRFLHGSIIVCQDDVNEAPAQLFKPTGQGGYAIETGHVGDYYFVAAASNAPLPRPRLSAIDGGKDLTALRAEFKYAVDTMHGLQEAAERSGEAIQTLQEAAERSRDAIQTLQDAAERSRSKTELLLTQNELHKIQISFLRKKLAAIETQRMPPLDALTG